MPKPQDDWDDDRPVRPRQRPPQVAQPERATTPPRPRPEGDPWGLYILFAIAKFGLIGIGCLLCLVALKAENVIQTAAWAGVACFVGILARMAQAEEHHRVR